MRAPPGRIPAPPFPVFLKWVNVPRVRMERELGHPVLVEFWDFCRPNSIRTLPYVKAWHERYSSHELRVIGVHCPGFAPSADPEAARAAVARLGIDYPVLLDPELEVWQDYGNQGWPARYLWDQRGTLFDYHYGEGAYADTERAIQELLGVTREPLAAVRPEDEPDAVLVPQTQDQPGAYSGPYEAGGVWGGVRRRRARARQRTRAARRASRRLPADRARAPHRLGAGARDRPRRDVPRDGLHPGTPGGPAAVGAGATRRPHR